MGISAKDVLAQDPELLRRELYQREMQQLNPDNTAAGAIGGLLGRGLGNVTRGRGFFASNDDALQRVTRLQGYQQEAMQIGGGDTVKTLQALKERLMGDRELAPLAAQIDEQLYKAEDRVYGRKTREEEVELRKKDFALREREAQERGYANNPDLLIADALKLDEDSPKRAELLNRASRLIGKENLDIAVKQAQIKKAEQGPEVSTRISPLYQTAEGDPLAERGGQLLTLDGKPYKGKTRTVSRDTFGNTIAAAAGTSGATTPASNPVLLEIERRRRAETTSRQQAAGTEETTVGPTGELETRIIKSAPATAAQKDAMTLKEAQEYNRSGKIPKRLIGQ
jgi:hypothetical protein